MELSADLTCNFEKKTFDIELSVLRRRNFWLVIPGKLQYNIRSIFNKDFCKVSMSHNFYGFYEILAKKTNCISCLSQQFQAK